MPHSSGWGQQQLLLQPRRRKRTLHRAAALWRLLALPLALLHARLPGCRAVDVIAASRLETCVFDVTLVSATPQPFLVCMYWCCVLLIR
jgi:hypothetical protein